MMFAKDRLAAKILVFDIEDADSLVKFARSPKYPTFEVRTVGSAGTVQIKFPHQEWIKPREWANNHLITVEKNLYSDMERLEVMSTDMRPLLNKGFIPRSCLDAFGGDLYDRLNAYELEKVPLILNIVTDWLDNIYYEYSHEEEDDEEY